jgi:TonB family protein
MSKYEKLGAFLLFDKVEEDRLSKNFIAGQIQNNQVQQIRWLRKFDHSLACMPDFILDMNQEIEILKALSNPALIRPGDIIKDKSDFAAVFDYFEGKNLRAVLQKCAQEGYPFTADHALLIASRVCVALEYLHSKKVKDQRLLHGYVSPESIFISYDGETKLLYLGLAQLLLKNPAMRDRLLQTHENYFAPEVQQTHKLDRAADVFSTGAVLYEMLVGEPLMKEPGTDIQQAIENAQMHNQSGDKVPVPPEIKKALHQALALDPTLRFTSIGDLRKILDQQLFTSDNAPTTFNLAFFMNSLFRENMDQEGKNIKTYKKLDVATYMKEEPPPAPLKSEHPVGAEAAKDISMAPIEMPRPVPSFGGAKADQAIVESKEKSKAPLFGGILVGLALIGAAVYFIAKPSEPQQGPATAALTSQKQTVDPERERLQQEAVAAQEEAKKKDQQLKDLQAKLDQLLKAQKDAKASAEKPPVDVATIQQLQLQAKQLEEERKRQEALAAEKMKEAATPPAAEAENEPEEKQAEQKTEPAATNQLAQNQPPPENQANQNEQPQSEPPTQKQETPAALNQQQPQQQQQAPAIQKNDSDPQPVSSVKEGDVVEMTPDLVKPELTNRVTPVYPPVARTRKVQGTVILSILVSETGNVSDIRVLRGAGGSAGLDEAAKAAARKWQFRPAVKDGKRVKVWVTYPVAFKLND